MPNLPQPATKPTYRPDVDGLRAVAVLLVFFNHLHTRFTGGYIGVDVFFVISGYLINSVILSDIAAGEFSIGTFYERRIRRIFPALLVMLLGTTLLAYRCFVPSEIEAFARSLLAALFSVSNFLFWHQSGYFDAPSSLKPLLHTWSLAVEEQFYIFFPLFLVVMRRLLPGRLKAATWTATAITFALACFWVRRNPTAAFFFAPLRAWELLFGAILSQRYLPAIDGKVQRELAALAGLLLILVPSLRYTSETPFPGLAALLPCLGTGLLIAAGETGSSLVGRVLAWRPFVFVGLISYSLYLWHWPILVFQNTSYILIAAPSGTKAMKIAVFMASMVVATLSWRYVETPFRKGKLRPGRRMLFAVNGVVGVVIASIGWRMVVSHGFSARFPSEAIEVDRFTNYDATTAFRENVCFIGPKSTYADFNRATCLADDATRKHYLLIGDSHAAHLYPGLSTVFPELNISQANTHSCLPFLPDSEDATDPDCSKMSQFIFGDYLLHHHVDAVLIAGRWEEPELGQLGRTIAWMAQHGIRVILFGPMMKFDVPLPRLIAISLRDRDPAAIERQRMNETLQVDRKLAALAQDKWKVRYISAFEDLCGTQVRMEEKAHPETSAGCPVYAVPGVPLLFDTNHLTPQGSILYARAMRARNQLQ
jgi:peptidoglycan/LPS O-acetylase OafA/YrhL